MGDDEINEWIADAVSDLVGEFLYYDRKNDEEVQPGVIEAAIRVGQITEDQIVAEFAKALHLGITEGR